MTTKEKKKLITVVKEQFCTYSVEGECTDAEALQTVKERLAVGAPIGLEKEGDAVVIRFELVEGSRHEVYDADGHLAKKAKS